MAQRVCGGGVRGASVAGGVGGVGVGAQGCVERVVFHADAVGLCAACGRAESTINTESQKSLCTAAGFGVFCAGPDGQEHGGDAAVCVVAAGLLAAGKDGGNQRIQN